MKVRFSRFALEHYARTTYTNSSIGEIVTIITCCTVLIICSAILRYTCHTTLIFSSDTLISHTSLRICIQPVSRITLITVFIGISVLQNHTLLTLLIFTCHTSVWKARVVLEIIPVFLVFVFECGLLTKIE